MVFHAPDVRTYCFDKARAIFRIERSYKKYKNDHFCKNYKNSLMQEPWSMGSLDFTENNEKKAKMPILTKSTQNSLRQKP